MPAPSRERLSAKAEAGVWAGDILPRLFLHLSHSSVLRRSPFANKVESENFNSCFLKHTHLGGSVQDATQQRETVTNSCFERAAKIVKLPTIVFLTAFTLQIVTCHHLHHHKPAKPRALHRLQGSVLASWLKHSPSKPEPCVQVRSESHCSCFVVCECIVPGRRAALPPLSATCAEQE